MSPTSWLILSTVAGQAGHRPASPHNYQPGDVMFYGRSDADWGQLVAEEQDHPEDLAAVIGQAKVGMQARSSRVGALGCARRGRAA